MITVGRMIAVFFAVAVFAPLLWMLLDREPPYDFISVEIEPQEVQQGAEITITFKVDPNRTACNPGLIYREFREESGKLHVYDPIQRATPPSFVDNKFSRIARLPDNIGPGPTTYRGMACYTCNPVQAWLRWPVCAETPTATFTVLPR